MPILRSEFPVVRTRKKNGRTYYDVDCRKAGWLGKQRLNFTKKNEALDKAREIGDQFQRTGIDGLNANSAGITNREFADWENQLNAHGKTLRDAVRFYLDHLNQPKPVPLACVKTLADRWVKSKSTDTNKPIRSRSLGEIRVLAARFGNDFPEVPVNELDKDDVMQVVSKLKTRQGKPISPQTRRNYVTKLKQFFKWCLSEGLIDTNPADTITVSVAAKVPEIYSVDECKRLLEVVQQPSHRALTGFVALGLFAGLRPSEVERLSWNEVHWDPLAVYVSPDVKGARKLRRVAVQKCGA
jgi:integrase